MVSLCPYVKGFMLLLLLSFLGGNKGSGHIEGIEQ
jgi:hypothetical protein